MTAANWQEVERHLLSVLTLAPAQRQAYLERVCSHDEAMRRLLESMLESEGEMGNFLETPVDTPLASRTSIDIPELQEGQRIGPYRVQNEIGRGGMSVVCRAMREDLHREVAIKVIKRGMDSAEILRRFLSEQRILANLNHPSIAQLYDCGTTEDGLPYFVMEYIKGEPIDVFCDRRNIPVADRIELFRRVCSAVHYAHQNLVVHRDIKPSNILVTDEGMPKLLDFGIAKVLDPQGSERLQPTAAWMRLMTPNYASPEQINGQAITTASDVYSLAVLLYELLTGRLPYRFETGSPPEIERVVRNTRPAKPSAIVLRPVKNSNGEQEHAPEALSGARATQPSKLAKLLRGDLDNIILTALRLQPQRRYSSVEQFSEDLRRSQIGLPIIAREDTFGYRVTSFLRRNRLPTFIVLAVIGMVATFAVIAMAQAVRVDRERQQTEQVSEFLIALFDASAAGSTHSDAITAQEILERGAARVHCDLEDQPEIRATLMDTIGRAFSNLHFFDRSIPLFEEALQIRRDIGNRSPLVADSLHNLATAQWKAGKYEASERNFQAALALRRRLDGENSEEIADILYDFGHLRIAVGDLEGAEHHARQAFKIRRKLLGEEHVTTARSKTLLAKCLRDLGEREEAEGLYREAVAILRESFGEHPDLAQALNGLGLLLVDRGELVAAEPPLREGLEMRRRLFGESHPIYAESLATLSFLLMERGDYETTIPLVRQTLDIHRQRYGEEHPAIAREQYNLALSLAEMGALQEAEKLYRETLVLARKLVGDTHPRVSNLRVDLATVLHTQGQVEEAETLYREGIAALKNSVGEQHLFLALARLGLGSLLADQGEFHTAEQLVRQSLPIVESSLGEQHWRAAQTKSEIAGSLIGQGRLSEAETLLRASYPLLEARRGIDAEVTRRARSHISKLHQAMGKPEQEPEWLIAQARGGGTNSSTELPLPPRFGSH